MKEGPILMTGGNVRAILEDRKNQTRRIFKGLTPPNCEGIHSCKVEDGFAKFHLNGKLAMHSGEWTRCPYGVAGDRLWVKETFVSIPIDGGEMGIAYRADGDDAFNNIENGYEWMGKWTPSIFMPRWASRITLEITEVRVQRLQEISEEDALAEGVDIRDSVIGTAIGAYYTLWNEINGQKSWPMNPYVWCISFKRL